MHVQFIINLLVKHVKVAKTPWLLTGAPASPGAPVGPAGPDSPLSPDGPFSPRCPWIPGRPCQTNKIKNIQLRLSLQQQQSTL